MKGFFNSLTSFYNDPHEKFFYNIILILIFAFIYTLMYKSQTKHFTIMVNENKKKELNGLYFLWFSLMSQFTMGFGDLYPSSSTAKTVIALQSSLFWFINLA